MVNGISYGVLLISKLTGKVTTITGKFNRISSAEKRAKFTASYGGEYTVKIFDSKTLDTVKTYTLIK